ncbi:interleukin-10 receptor subunit beta-like [Clupea harengus]|uniref:Interleukin-10 receptor subunit beta-like n=1 Tax=Clupea harengus TaxID=7950 RepID=A0A8M1K5G6_CLUHA|nr:interleukin-10 receptor subunit beta-like [Clupea harengus]
MATGSFWQIFLAAVFGVSGVLAVLPPPENVRIFSQDLGLILLWDPPANTSDKLNYTTEYRTSGHLPGCVSQSETSCDVTNKISVFGTYQLRVRAELQEEASDWVTLDDFTVDDMTNISAPSVKLSTRQGEIEVQISDPVMRLGNFQEVYQPVDYIITYWREGDTHRIQQKSDQSHVILTANQLTAKARYCVQVHIQVRFLNKNSTASNDTCLTNSTHGGPPLTSYKVAVWQILLLMLASFLAVGLGALLLFLVGWTSYRGLRYVLPKDKLPEHFVKQYLLETPLSLLEQARGPPVELYHQLSIVMEAPQPPLLAGVQHCSSHSHPQQPEGKGGTEGEREREEEEQRESGGGEIERKGDDGILNSH